MSRKLIEMKAGILSDLRRGLAKDAHKKQRVQYNEDVLPEQERKLSSSLALEREKEKEKGREGKELRHS